MPVRLTRSTGVSTPRTHLRHIRASVASGAQAHPAAPLAYQIVTYVASAGMPASAVLVWMPRLVLNLFLNLFWIPRWGIAGAAASSTLCYFLVLALHLALWSRRIHGSLREALVLRRSDLREMQGLAGLVEWS